MKRRSTMLVMLLFFVAVAIAAWAQSSNAPQSKDFSATDPIIDGSIHPEQIPDVIAYRLWFITVSELPGVTEDQQHRQTAHLTNAGLSESDIQSAIGILASFKMRYAELIARYNDSTTKDISAFVRDRDSLVLGTRNSLKAVLSSDGMANFDQHVRREKSHMKIAKEAQ